MNTEQYNKTPETDPAEELISLVSLLKYYGFVAKEICAQASETIARLEKERDEARAEVGRLRADDIVPKAVGDELIALRAEVERIRQHLPCNDEWMSAIELAADDFRKEAESLRAEIKDMEAKYDERVKLCLGLRAQLAQRDEALKVAKELLARSLPVIESDAQMMADITRHAPHDPASQAIHDSTEYESERLCREIPTALRRIEELTKGDGP